MGFGGCSPSEKLLHMTMSQQTTKHMFPYVLRRTACTKGTNFERVLVSNYSMNSQVNGLELTRPFTCLRFGNSPKAFYFVLLLTTTDCGLLARVNLIASRLEQVK
eukprot:3891839-Amphidinium_carterae.1